jgi:hypothetical protein
VLLDVRVGAVEQRQRLELGAFGGAEQPRPQLTAQRSPMSSAEWASAGV